MPENKILFRASFSVCSLWYQKKINDAIKAYFKIEGFVPKEWIIGKGYHELWQKQIERTSKLPEELGGSQLINPICEEKMVINGKELSPYADFMEVVFVPDCIDLGNMEVLEFKTGTGSSSNYARGWQGILYGYLLHIKGYPVKKVKIIRYNQYTKETEVSIIWITEKTNRMAKEWIISMASDMHAYLMENDLYSKFKELNDIELLDD